MDHKLHRFAPRTCSMVKKLGLTSLFFNSSEASLSSSVSSTTSFSTAASSWQWPSCTQARTLSFRRDSPEIVSMRHYSNREGDLRTSMNPAAYYYMLDPGDEHHQHARSVSNSSESPCTAAAEEDEDEAIVRSLVRSNGRLFFEPESTSSLAKMKMKAAAAAAAFDGATALAIDSADPYGDFRRSMEEMVMSHGVNDDWGWLEEMLGWYLSANGKKTHGLIVGAFVDLLVALTSAPSSSSGAKKGANQRQSST